MQNNAPRTELNDAERKAIDALAVRDFDTLLPSELAHLRARRSYLTKDQLARLEDVDEEKTPEPPAPPSAPADPAAGSTPAGDPPAGDPQKEPKEELTKDQITEKLLAAGLKAGVDFDPRAKKAELQARLDQIAA